MDLAQLPYAAPRAVDGLADCYFYHTIELPTFGVIHGEWDLRGRVDEYLGGVDLAGKRILELGTANGFLCFEMEKRGAEVVAYDLSENDDWDIVPYGGAAPAEQIVERRMHLRRINNAWWLTHRLLNSRAKVVYGDVYSVPETIGGVDVATFGCILLHVRDPFLALQRAARLVKEAIVVTEVLPSGIMPARGLFKRLLRRLSSSHGDATLSAPRFLPDPEARQPTETWWQLPPDLIVRFLHVLGFPSATVVHHRQKHRGGEMELYTVVAKRRP